MIAELTGKTEQEIHDMRHENGIVAAYKIVDTCAAGVRGRDTILLFRLW